MCTNIGWHFADYQIVWKFEDLSSGFNIEEMGQIYVIINSCFQVNSPKTDQPTTILQLYA